MSPGMSPHSAEGFARNANEEITLGVPTWRYIHNYPFAPDPMR